MANLAGADVGAHPERGASQLTIDVDGNAVWFEVKHLQQEWRIDVSKAPPMPKNRDEVGRRPILPVSLVIQTLDRRLLNVTLYGRRVDPDGRNPADQLTQIWVHRRELWPPWLPLYLDLLATLGVLDSDWADRWR